MRCGLAASMLRSSHQRNQFLLFKQAIVYQLYMITFGIWIGLLAPFMTYLSYETRGHIRGMIGNDLIEKISK